MAALEDGGSARRRARPLVLWRFVLYARLALRRSRPGPARAGGCSLWGGVSGQDRRTFGVDRASGAARGAQDRRAGSNAIRDGRRCFSRGGVQILFVLVATM